MNFFILKNDCDKIMCAGTKAVIYYARPAPDKNIILL